MAQEGPKMAHDKPNMLQRGGVVDQGRMRGYARRRGEMRRIAWVALLKTTNTLQTGKEHSNTPQRAEGTVADNFRHL